MKTLILNKNIFKLRKTLSLVLFTLLFSFVSCSDSENIDGLEEDTALIEKIEEASKVIVDENSLPSQSASTFNGDFADSYIETVQLASNLGYKVSVLTDNVSRIEDKSDVFFNMEGRQLVDKNERRKGKRNRCFEFIFPIDFIMPDNSSITLESKDDWILIKNWYTENPDERERPELVFPVNILLKEDGSTQTLIDVEDLREVKKSCRIGRDKRKCFSLILPVSFTMPDGTVIEVNQKEDFRLVRAWHKDNPDVTEKGSLNFPLDIEYKDGTTATILNETEFEEAKNSCDD